MTFGDAKHWGRSVLTAVIAPSIIGAASGIATVSSLEARTDSLRRDVQRNERAIDRLEGFHYGPKKANETEESPKDAAALEAHRPVPEAVSTAS